MTKITLYSAGCPKCKVIETKLKMKNLNYEIVSDEAEMEKLGIKSLPMMRLDDGPLMDFSATNKWINEAIPNGNN